MGVGLFRMCSAPGPGSPAHGASSAGYRAPPVVAGIAGPGDLPSGRYMPTWANVGR
jgi:hypothetical protein